MSRQPLRSSRLAHAALGATIIAVPASATALAEAATTPSASGTGAPITEHVASRQIKYGHDVIVTGSAPSSDAGQRVYLEYSPGGSRSWQQVADGVVGDNGRFQLSARLRNSGQLSVAGAWQRGPGGPGAPAEAGDTGSAGSGDPTHVTVAASVRVRARSLDELGGQRLELSGRLLPGTAGRVVRLQSGQDGRWHTLASARTDRGGRFDVKFTAAGSGRQRLRALFTGDSLNGSATSGAGSVTVFVQSVASWYDDGGSTACGFHAYYGVANRTLPCGTKVSFAYHGRTVTAVVDDRGPFAAGRDWDLNQNTASALGFGGVDSVWSSQ